MRTLIARLKQNRKAGLIGTAIAVAIGVLAYSTRLGEEAERLSYDLACLRPGTRAPTNAVVIEMDELAYRALKQDYGRLWDRSYHAALLGQLQRDGARLVVLDLFLSDTGTNQVTGPDLLRAVEQNRKLAAAIRDNPRVVLAADWAALEHTGLVGGSVIMPFADFALAASNRWGVTGVELDADLTVRRHYSGTENDPSLAWRAAMLLDAPVTQQPENRLTPRWLRYYGPYPAFTRLSYHIALEEPSGFFRDKLVFVGGRPRTLLVGQQTDVFRTPLMRWQAAYTPGVELVATTVLNLLREDWLRRMSPSKELTLLLLCGLLFGYGLSALRPLPALAAAAVGVCLVSLLALALAWTRSIWFSWVTVCGIQVPAALAWGVLWNTLELQRQKRALEESLSRFQAGRVPFAPASHETIHPQVSLPPGVTGATPAAPAAHAEAGPTRVISPAEQESPPPPVPNHRLLRRVGQGAYGDVWLAQDDLGLYHGVKVVYRNRFSQSDPYEREFRGLQRYTPISLNHAGLVHILHVGRNDAEGYFFYIMELADSEDGSSVVNPATYNPRSLAGEMRRRKRIPATECIDLSLHMTAALDFLHRQQLVHRDIKPANVIFVGGTPKFADIGLVTAISTEAVDCSYVGTEGYMPPEGPGKPQADIFALGIVMYEAVMGRPRQDFPVIASSLASSSNVLELFGLNHIILKACDPNPARRYRSAAVMHQDLLALQRRLEKGTRRPGPKAGTRNGGTKRIE